MPRFAHSSVLALWLATSSTVLAQAPQTADSPHTRTEDVIYGRKFGTALTLDVFKPTAKPNGIGIIAVVSGGWYSSHDGIPEGFIRLLTARRYTVFAVVHGSQPKFTIPEVVEDMNRAVRFIRTHAAEYGVGNHAKA